MQRHIIFESRRYKVIKSLTDTGNERWSLWYRGQYNDTLLLELPVRDYIIDRFKEREAELNRIVT